MACGVFSLVERAVAKTDPSYPGASRSPTMEGDTVVWILLIRTGMLLPRILKGHSIEYQDFVVQIGPGREGELTVRVLESPAGEGFAPFQLPRTLREWLRLRIGPARTVRNLLSEDPDGGAAEFLAPRQLGEALFRALFVGQVGELFAHSLGAVGERGLRLRLRFQLDVEDPRLTHLHSLPWELLFQPDTRDFLGLSRRTPIVRSLDVPRSVPPITLPSPLRILVIPAAPAGLDPLDLEAEWRHIRQAWEGLPGVEVVFLDLTGIAPLRQVLLESTFHVLHFMGHGEVDPITGEGVLLFAGPDGTRTPVTGESLATILKDFRALRLVFLNACETGRTPDGTEVDPFAGVATALVLAGLPAVVAMQLPISDEAAVLFSWTVYLRLAAGDPIDAAVSEGRQVLYSPGTTDWAIPVLFTRIPDGRIFERSAPPPPARRGLRKALASSRRHLGRIAAACGAVLLAGLALWGRERLGPLLSRTDLPRIEQVQVGDLRVARYEVTNADYLRFVRARPAWRKNRIPAAMHDGDYLQHWQSSTAYPEGRGDHPVTFVPQAAARAFCRWVGGDLPSVDEWQAVAHKDRSPYPWGTVDTSSTSPLNFCDAACPQVHRGGTHLSRFRDNYPETAPVTAFPNGRTPEGVFNLSGNVWEWTLTISGDKGVTLGGSYSSTFEECTTDTEMWEPITKCARDGGFRCVWEMK
jgi:hypothetical protein